MFSSSSESELVANNRHVLVIVCLCKPHIIRVPGLQLYYNMSRVELDRAREDFERGIQDAKIQLIKEMLWDFTKGVGLMAVGGVTYNPAFIVAGVSSVIEGTDGMPDVLAQLTAVIYQVDVSRLLYCYFFT